jgi:hypothetical protein
MHPFLSGRPSRAKVLADFLARVRERGDVWLATLGEIAAHAERTIPAAATRRLDLPQL